LQFILTIFVIYFLVLVFLYFYQRNLLYHPNVNNYSGDKISVNIRKIKISTSDNINLLGWYHKKNLQDYKTLIYFYNLWSDIWLFFIWRKIRKLSFDRNNFGIYWCIFSKEKKCSKNLGRIYCN